MRSLPNRTQADDEVIEDLLTALRSGTEHAQQQGNLMAFIAQCQTAYTRLYGIHGKCYRLSRPTCTEYDYTLRSNPVIGPVSYG
jgi:hypothetical protein